MCGVNVYVCVVLEQNLTGEVLSDLFSPRKVDAEFIHHFALKTL